MDIDTGDDDCQCEEGAPPWMATFSDLATLLLTFFVLLLSFAELDITEFKTMLGSIKEAFGVQTVAPGDLEAAATSPIEFMDLPTSLAMPLNDLEAAQMRAIRNYMEEHGMSDDADLVQDDRGVVLRLRDSLLFDTGEAVIKEDGKEVLDQIREMSSAFPEGLSVEGHTDDRPIRTFRFPSNWELSSARAAAAVRHMQRDGPLPVRRLRVVGYGATAPLDEASTAASRARNRRVEFVFERPSGDPTAPPDHARAPPVSADVDVLNGGT
jgi:chemotaxis protein MotB